MAEKEHIQALFTRYLANTISKSEYQELLRYFGIDGNAEDARQLLYTAFNAEGLTPAVSEDTITEVTDTVHQRLQRHMAKAPHRLKLYRWLPYAAAVLLVVAWYTMQQGKKAQYHNGTVATANPLPQDLPPGTNRASLVLDNGQAINLKASQNGITSTAQGISYADGTNLAKLTETKYATLITPRAGQYALTLPDGSKVWLNAASTLKYPVQFTGAQRKVELTGEAYFEVAHNKTQPFIVTTATQEVQVLGTHFNVKSYADDTQATTTLAEGSVQVTAANGQRPITLKPNEQVINGGGEFKKLAANMNVALAWKNDQLYFEDADLQTVLKEISRWYDVDIDYRGAPSKELFTGGVKRQANLSAMIKILELSGVHATLQVHHAQRTLIVN